jgi:hypothetical protein
MISKELKETFEAVGAELIEDGIGFRLYRAEDAGIMFNIFIDVRGDYSVSLDNHVTVHDDALPVPICKFANDMTKYLTSHATV